MEDNLDPVEQMEAIVSDASLKLAAEQTKMHAEMILLSAVARKPRIEGGLLFKASSQGMDYMTGVLVAIGLSARNWGRVIADDADLDFTKYIDPEAEKECEGDDAFAHRMLREVLAITDVPEVDGLRSEMAMFAQQVGGHAWGRMVVHLIGMLADLVRTVMDIRNGDYAPEGELSDITDLAEAIDLLDRPDGGDDR